ncbi:MAG: HNH endonuclease [Bacteriovoracaceae bacterium]|nr:HNH endonuclease [Bacteriovoracaceae bacterium]
MDRLVALKYMPIDSPGTHLIKHLDGDPSNCAVENLVWVSRSDNAKSLHRGKKRGITAYGSRWSANISNGGKTQYLGLHDTKEKAYEAFRIAFVEQNGVEPW